ncbi:hypothetical protein MJN69_28475, partial [Salmonella enterica subsp. enterica serovar Kentucky]|nr:hypothetical protein [Salmonella enterica subsp. enterica serovar Kentucky]
LVDEINTSDEVILGLMEGREVLNVRYMQRKKLIDRVTGSAAEHLSWFFWCLAQSIFSLSWEPYREGHGWRCS